MAEVRVRYSFPDPGLFDLVAAMGEFTNSGSGALVDLAPPDMPILVVPLDGRWHTARGSDGAFIRIERAVLGGPSSAASRLSGEGGRAFMAGLHPLCWPLLFNRSAADYANGQVAFAELVGDGAASLEQALRTAPDFEARVALANGFFLDLPRRSLPEGLAGRIMALRLALADPDCASTLDCAQRVGISQTRLLRLAKSSFGFTPKLLIRIARFRRMLHRADRHSYSQWRAFIDAQYVDQSHLIRDFQEFLGMSPTAYFALERPFVEAAFAEARRLLGDPGLDAGGG